MALPLDKLLPPPLPTIYLYIFHIIHFHPRLFLIFLFHLEFKGKKLMGRFVCCKQSEEIDKFNNIKSLSLTIYIYQN